VRRQTPRYIQAELCIELICTDAPWARARSRPGPAQAGLPAAARRGQLRQPQLPADGGLPRVAAAEVLCPPVASTLIIKSIQQPPAAQGAPSAAPCVHAQLWQECNTVVQVAVHTTQGGPSGAPADEAGHRAGARALPARGPAGRAGAGGPAPGRAAPVRRGCGGGARARSPGGAAAAARRLCRRARDAARKLGCASVVGQYTIGPSQPPPRFRRADLLGCNPLHVSLTLFGMVLSTPLGGHDTRSLKKMRMRRAGRRKPSGSRHEPRRGCRQRPGRGCGPLERAPAGDQPGGSRERASECTGAGALLARPPPEVRPSQHAHSARCSQLQGGCSRGAAAAQAHAGAGAASLSRRMSCTGALGEGPVMFEGACAGS